jgi:CubicO group peptidase (beta-lactamase class C family)
VTSVDNPLPVDPDTLFLLGSLTKTYTATTLLRLAADGHVELDAPVRRYVPELRLKDEHATAQVTVRNCSTTPPGWTFGSSTTSGRATTRWPATWPGWPTWS